MTSVRVLLVGVAGPVPSARGRLAVTRCCRPASGPRFPVYGWGPTNSGPAVRCCGQLDLLWTTGRHGSAAAQDCRCPAVRQHTDRKATLTVAVHRQTAAATVHRQDRHRPFLSVPIGKLDTGGRRPSPPQVGRRTTTVFCTPGASRGHSPQRSASLAFGHRGSGVRHRESGLQTASLVFGHPELGFRARRACIPAGSSVAVVAGSTVVTRR